MHVYVCFDRDVNIIRTIYMCIHIYIYNQCILWNWTPSISLYSFSGAFSIQPSSELAKPWRKNTMAFRAEAHRRSDRKHPQCALQGQSPGTPSRQNHQRFLYRWPIGANQKLLNNKWSKEIRSGDGNYGFAIWSYHFVNKKSPCAQGWVGLIVVCSFLAFYSLWSNLEWSDLDDFDLYEAQVCRLYLNLPTDGWFNKDCITYSWEIRFIHQGKLKYSWNNSWVLSVSFMYIWRCRSCLD